jgi:hypothetical protein
MYYESGSPGRASSSQTWSGGMPDPFGSSTTANYIYSIYANYTPSAPPQYTLTTNVVGQGSITLNPPGGVYEAGTVVTVTATPDSGWKFDNWSGDLSGSTNPTTITMNSNKSVTANFSLDVPTGTVGNTTVFSSTSTSAYRRAMPFTMPENGVITSVTMYHTGGSGDMILAVYDGESTPQARLAVTTETAVSSSTGWQTINLTSSAAISAGETVWLPGSMSLTRESGIKPVHPGDTSPVKRGPAACLIPLEAVHKPVISTQFMPLTTNNHLAGTDIQTYKQT